MFKCCRLFRFCKLSNRSSFSTYKEYIKSKALPIGSVVFTASFVSLAYFYKKYKVKDIETRIAKEKKAIAHVGLPEIGGEFNLIDYNGNKVSLLDFQGRWLMIYFGFCNCPDVCPDELEKLSMVADRLAMTKGVETVTPLFVSVDPERDTPAIMKEYLKEFSDKILGLTGTPETIKDISKAYRIYYSKGPVDKFGDYIVDHAIIMYLIGPRGEFVEYYGQTKSVPEICKSIALHMKHKKMEAEGAI